MITGRQLREAVNEEGIEDFESEDFLAVLRYLIDETDWVLGDGTDWIDEANEHLSKAHAILMEGQND